MHRKIHVLETLFNKVDIVLVFLLITLTIINTFSSVFFVHFEQVNDSWQGKIIGKYMCWRLFLIKLTSFLVFCSLCWTSKWQLAGKKLLKTSKTCFVLIIRSHMFFEVGVLHIEQLVWLLLYLERLNDCNLQSKQYISASIIQDQSTNSSCI